MVTVDVLNTVTVSIASLHHNVGDIPLRHILVQHGDLSSQTRDLMRELLRFQFGVGPVIQVIRKAKVDIATINVVDNHANCAQTVTLFTNATTQEIGRLRLIYQSGPTVNKTRVIRSCLKIGGSGQRFPIFESDCVRSFVPQFCALQVDIAAGPAIAKRDWKRCLTVRDRQQSHSVSHCALKLRESDNVETIERFTSGVSQATHLQVNFGLIHDKPLHPGHVQRECVSSRVLGTLNFPRNGGFPQGRVGGIVEVVGSRLKLHQVK